MTLCVDPTFAKSEIDAWIEFDPGCRVTVPTDWALAWHDPEILV
jgi:hypothetical protein